MSDWSKHFIEEIRDELYLVRDWIYGTRPEYKNSDFVFEESREIWDDGQLMGILKLKFWLEDREPMVSVQFKNEKTKISQPITITNVFQFHSVLTLFKVVQDDNWIKRNGYIEKQMEIERRANLIIEIREGEKVVYDAFQHDRKIAVDATYNFIDSTLSFHIPHFLIKDFAKLKTLTLLYLKKYTCMYPEITYRYFNPNCHETFTLNDIELD